MIQRVAKLAVCVRSALIGGAVLMAHPSSVSAADASRATYWTDMFEYSSPFSPCAMNCAVHGFGGVQVLSSMSSIFTRGRRPDDWRLGKSTVVGGDFSREVVRYGDWWAFETEIGAAKRFGRQDEFETWAALYWRWKVFPWSDYVRTTAAISTGINWASDVSGHEKEKSPGHTSQLLHYLAPEITFGPVSNPNLDVVFRFHHRSGGELAAFNNTGGGSQYMTMGVRYHW